MNQQLTPKQYFSSEAVQGKFEKLLGQKAQGFIASVLQTVNDSKLLSKADPATIFNAAATAASLDLPINQSLGRAWIVPFKGQAQFQIGYKGFVELAQRSGKYRSINAIAVYQNQYKGFNSLTEEIDADFSIDGEGQVVGYAAHFELLNGFTKTVYWSREKVEKHARRFSKSFNNGPWKTDFDAMAIKTVLKYTLATWGVLSIEMQTAHVADQAVQPEEGKFQYLDNVQDIEADNEAIETARIESFLEKVKTRDDLDMLEDSLEGQEISEEAKKAIADKREELSTKD